MYIFNQFFIITQCRKSVYIEFAFNSSIYFRHSINNQFEQKWITKNIRFIAMPKATRKKTISSSWPPWMWKQIQQILATLEVIWTWSIHFGTTIFSHNVCLIIIKIIHAQNQSRPNYKKWKSSNQRRCEKYWLERESRGEQVWIQLFFKAIIE